MKSPHPHGLPGWLLIAIFIFLARPAAKGGGDTAREVLLMAEGEMLQYSTAAVPANWFLPLPDPGWATGVSGFGPPSMYQTVGTPGTFTQIKLRRTLTLNLRPTTLKLSLRHEAKTFTLFINGVSVLSPAVKDLPLPDAKGFRHYEVASGAARLVQGANLVALAVEGNLAVPVLSGQMIGPFAYPLTMKTGDAFTVEGGTFEFTVWRNGYPEESITLDPGLAGATAADLQLTRGGVPISMSGSGRLLSFSTQWGPTDTVQHFQLRVRNDAHAEALERIEVICRSSRLFCLVPPNDTMVSRTLPAGEGSLQQAISNANQQPGPDVVGFSDEEGVPFSKFPVTIDLEPAFYGFIISGGLRLEGPDTPGRVTIRANGGTAFRAGQDFARTAPSPLVLRRLVIQGASAGLETSRYNEDVIVEDCEFLQNRLPLGIYVLSNRVEIRRCLFLDSNQAAITFSYGPPTLSLIENCTFFETIGPAIAAGISTPQVTHCTMVDCLGGVSNNASEMRNCLLSGTCVSSNTGLLRDRGGNFFECSPAGNPLSIGGTAAQPLDARLEPLAFNGGFTRTIAIRADSPALDLAIPLPGTAPAFDQRGSGYPRAVGRAGDAGAFERQFLPADLVIGAATAAVYDAGSGLYFQVLSVANRSPWEMSGFRLTVEGLPPGVTLYNASEGQLIDVVRNLRPQGSAYLLLQYRADSPYLWIQPRLGLETLTDSLKPAAPARPMSVIPARRESGMMRLALTVTPQRSYRIQFSNDLKKWHPAGPPRYAESTNLQWDDDGRDTGPDPLRQPARFYRVLQD
jgi:Right handed beta helix region